MLSDAPSLFPEDSHAKAQSSPSQYKHAFASLEPLRVSSQPMAYPELPKQNGAEVREDWLLFFASFATFC